MVLNQWRQPQTLRRLVWVLVSLPLAWLMAKALAIELGANPVETLEHETGSWALILLLASLAVTPLRQWTGWGFVAPLRRTLGLFGFAYAALHVLIYAVLDRSLLWSELLADLVKRPYVMLGMAAFTLLLVLACTSPRRVVKRLGAARWKVLHRAVYLAVPLAVLHFTWLKMDKNLLARPLSYAAVLGVLLGLRLWWLKRPARGAAGLQSSPAGE
ncbi:sulfoxide reductase heme-binding subunit YedZ [Limnobacter humi]|uniref:Protein-methionine-sulfoxide reductase heme-binding subunit MsrQ n=1 Tax=Limnobacter humi TaxID=1778671 RepID=A0ABT1WCS8_9BURK|nr:protein-methionine-sulfoxide reductase heme-binding subunit MsrQ [Limnobacter humi]MCQ8895317.1 sulfoxide reductase heme-binding subunit YedZ [Limnobacter humi]